MDTKAQRPQRLVCNADWLWEIERKTSRSTRTKSLADSSQTLTGGLVEKSQSTRTKSTAIRSEYYLADPLNGRQVQGAMSSAIRLVALRFSRSSLAAQADVKHTSSDGNAWVHFRYCRQAEYTHNAERGPPTIRGHSGPHPPLKRRPSNSSATNRQLT